MPQAFPPTGPDDIARVQQADLILDCTGEDEVTQAMAAFAWSGVHTFWSFALDWQARRSFAYLTQGERFPAEVFLQAVRAELDADPTTLAGRELAREGVGCWHPVMPARIDHIWILAALAVSQLDEALRTGTAWDCLVVCERDETSANNGVCRVR